MSEFDEKMERLRAGFARRISEDRARLAAALDPLDPAMIGSIAHRLAGSGGLFGYPEISSLASEVEDTVDAGNEEQVRSRASSLLDLLSRLDTSS